MCAIINQQKIIAQFQFISIIFVLLIISSLFSQRALAQLTTSVISLKQLTAQDDLFLRGLGASQQLYLPNQSNWKINTIKLHLMLSGDGIAEHNLTLTALINDDPLSSLALAANENQKTWDIEIPEKYIHGPFITLTIKRNLSEEGVNCNGLVDSSHWIKLAGDSSIVYIYDEQIMHPLLSTYPYPFINQLNTNKDDVIVLLPEQLAKQDLAALYYIAHGLYQEATWRGVNIMPMQQGMTTSPQLNHSNIILIGTANKIYPFLKQLDWPLKLNAENLLVDADQKIIADNTGMVIANTSPWNPNKALLIVTGNSNAAVLNAAMGLSAKDFEKKVLSNKYVFINGAVNEDILGIDWNDTSLKELGFKDTVIYGGEQALVKYEITLPVNKVPKSMDFDLQYKTSAALSSIYNSFVSLKVNNTPVATEQIHFKNSRYNWHIHIDEDNLKTGKNQFVFNFDLRFRHQNCLPIDLASAWAIVYADSKIKVKFVKKEKKESIMNFQEFNLARQNLSLFIPHQTLIPNQQLIGIILALAQNIERVNQFEIDDESDDLKKSQQSSHVIYIGDIAANPKLAAVQNQLPFYYQNQQLVLRKDLVPYFHLSEETPAAILEIVPSVFSDRYQMLLITAPNVAAYQIALDVLFNPAKNFYLKDNAALIFKDGTFTSVNTARLEIKAANNQEIKVAKETALIGLSTLGIIFFGLLFMLIMIRRLRWYFSKNTPKDGQ